VKKAFAALNPKLSGVVLGEHLAPDRQAVGAVLRSERTREEKECKGR
jgi:hypothetical protein